MRVVRATCLAPVLALACEAAPVRPQPTLPLEACHLAGSDRPAQCGVLPRPEDPSRPDGRELSLRVVVVPASDVARHHPLYLLAGGPGQAASEAFAPLLGIFDELGRDRDIVLVDQRGTGASAPLDCEAPDDRTLAERLDEHNDLVLLRACLAGYDVDPRNFTTAIAMEDLDAVRQSLDHPVIDLLGGSYGTRAALVYARAHPDHVGRIVIDGVAPVDMAMPASFARDGEAALAGVFRDCAAAPACAGAFPDAAAAFRRWHAELRASPRKLLVEDPRKYEHVEIPLSADMVGFAVRNILYSPALSAMLPLALHRAEHGDPDALIASALVMGDAVGEAFSTGMFLAVVCAEDVPWIDDAKLREQGDTVLDTRMVELFRESCSVWPRAELPAGYREPVQLELPTLVLSGALDPVTPPRWGEHALAGLSAGRHVVVPGAGHGTLQYPCVAGLVQAFLDGADTLEVGCVEHTARPPFVVDFAGPPQ
jgi:pimeloyl-ACP methyl ester carboxylesterase